MLFDFFVSVSDLKDNINRKILWFFRYEEQINCSVWSRYSKELNNFNIFIIGTGALGCELLKNVSLIGISISKK